MSAQILRRLIPALVAAPLVLCLVPGAAAAAPADGAGDDTTAWSLVPADALGTPDGRSRFELEATRGETVRDHVLVSNASTVEQTFMVYAADAINTASGGYDVQPRTALPVDAAAWVKVDQPLLTVPALTSALVTFTITVPEEVTPGDHPGGIVVSLQDPQSDPSGVLLDTRVAIRLNVRVPGALMPELTVTNVRAGYGGTLVPFGRAPLTVRYDVVNTGNVKIVGTPRVRVTGPLGQVLAERPVGDDDPLPHQTGEILPGQGFTSEVVLDHVAAHFVEHVVVDVDMVAAPGPETTVPMVSSTASATIAAVPWTGLLLVLVVLAVAVGVSLRWRQRRAWARQYWREKEVRQEASGAAAGAGTFAALAAVVGLGGALGLASVLVDPAAAPAAAADPKVGPSVVLTVPAPPSASASPSPSPSGRAWSPPSASSVVPPSQSGEDVLPALLPPSEPTPEPSGGVVVPPTPTGAATPDLTWNRSKGPTGPQLALITLTTVGGLVGAGVGIRHVLLARAAMKVAAVQRAGAMA